MKKPTRQYNTNLAAEFWVLSALYRLGVEAQLTLGNKKSVDILILHDSQTVRTVDVKGVADPYDWPADNLRITDSRTHFYVLLSFEGNISDPLAGPSVWIVPSSEIDHFIKRYRTRAVVSRSLMKRDGNRYLNAWPQLHE